MTMYGMVGLHNRNTYMTMQGMTGLHDQNTNTTIQGMVGLHTITKQTPWQGMSGTYYDMLLDMLYISPDFLTKTAPEVMAMQDYSYSADVWSYGIVVFELIHGTV